MNEPLFTWEKGGAGGADRVGDDSAAAPIGGSVADIQMRAAADAAKSAADASPRKRGRPRTDGSNRGGDSRALQTQIDGAILAQLDALHDPEAWGALLSLPGDAVFAVTGRERWEVKREERKTLGVTGSAFARTLMITNPRALAGMMLAAALFSCYGTRALTELKDYRAKQTSEPKAPDAK